MLEVRTNKKTLGALSTVTNSPEWEFFVAYISQIRESENVKLAKQGLSHDESNFLRGSISRLERVLQLRESVEGELASTALEVEQGD